MASNVRARVRHLRNRKWARIRHQTDLIAWVAAQSSRLLSSRSGHTVAPVHVANTDATGTLTVSGQPSNTQTVTIGGKTYIFRTALTEAKATATATTDNTNAADTSTLTLGSVVYTFQASLTAGSANAVHVLIGANADATLLNLARAINNSGGTPGTDYSTTGTAAHSLFASATSVTSHAILLTAKAVGVAANVATTSTTSPNSHITFGGALATGGVDAIVNEVLIDDTAAHTRDNLVVATSAGSGAGTKYATGTTANADAVGTAASTNMLVTALAHGTAGDSVATSETASNMSFGDTHLTGGVTETWGPTWTATSHGQTDLAGPYMLSTSVTLPTGVSATELYWIKKVDANVIKLALSLADVIAGAFVTTTSAGTGTHTLKRATGNEGTFEMLRRNKFEAIFAATDIDNLV